MEKATKTNTITLQDHGVMMSDYFSGTSGVMISVSIDNKTTIEQVIQSIEQEFNMVFDHIQYTAQYHNFIGDIDKQLDQIISDLKKENKDKMQDIVKPDLDFCFETESQEDIDFQEYPVYILSLEFSWNEPETYTIEELEKMRISKDKLFKNLMKVKTFDFALPQEWLDNFSNRHQCKLKGITYELIRSTTVWVYPESKPLSLCTEVQEQIDLYMDMQYSL
jgi:hypothetical protein